LQLRIAVNEGLDAGSTCRQVERRPTMPLKKIAAAASRVVRADAARAPAPAVRASLGVAPPGLEFIRLQGAGDRVLVYFPGIVDATFSPKELVRRRERLFAPWLATRTLYIVSRRRPLPEGWSVVDMARDYAEAIEWIGDTERVEHGQIDVAGASFGGCVAMQFALDHAPLLRRLVLQQVAGRGDPEKQLLARDWMADLERGRYLSFARSLLNHNDAGQRRWLNDLIAIGSYPMVRRDLDRRCADMAASLRAIDGFDVMARLPGIEAWTLVIGGQRDAMVPSPLMQETAAAIPRSLLVLFPDGSHSVQVEYTVEYGEALRQFLDATDPHGQAHRGEILGASIPNAVVNPAVDRWHGDASGS
jgi:pimeloyl-ACP methyl ester carboxylesterase